MVNLILLTFYFAMGFPLALLAFRNALKLSNRVDMTDDKSLKLVKAKARKPFRNGVVQGIGSLLFGIAAILVASSKGGVAMLFPIILVLLSAASLIYLFVSYYAGMAQARKNKEIYDKKKDIKKKEKKAEKEAKPMRKLEQKVALAQAKGELSAVRQERLVGLVDTVGHVVDAAQTMEVNGLQRQVDTADLRNQALIATAQGQMAKSRIETAMATEKNKQSALKTANRAARIGMITNPHAAMDYVEASGAMEESKQLADSLAGNVLGSAAKPVDVDYKEVTNTMKSAVTPEDLEFAENVKQLGQQALFDFLTKGAQSFDIDTDGRQAEELADDIIRFTPKAMMECVPNDLNNQQQAAFLLEKMGVAPNVV